MPQVARHFRHMSRVLGRSGGAIPVSVKIGSVVHSTTPAGVALKCFFMEREATVQVDGREFLAATPTASFCISDLPSIPERGAKVIFPDETFTVDHSEKTQGGMVDVILVNAKPT